MNNNNDEKITNDVTKKVYITNSLQLSKKYIVINKNIINRYHFLSFFINEEALFFEDIYFSIFYILTFEEDDENHEDNENQKDDENQEDDKSKEAKERKVKEKNKKGKCLIYNFIINKLNKSYCKNSLPYYDFKDALLNLYFINLKKSFIYSNLHLSGYEYDLNHDINEWLNMVKYEDVIYIYPYISRIVNIEHDYTF